MLDRLTDLVWTRSADLTGAEVTWSEALAAVEMLQAELSRAEVRRRRELRPSRGRSRWRLPNILITAHQYAGQLAVSPKST